MEHKKKTFLIYPVILVLILNLCSGCSSNHDEGIFIIKNNISDYNVRYIPYKDNLKFSLLTDDLEKGINEPRKIKSVYDTDVYIKEEVQRKDIDNNQEMVVIHVNLDSHYKSPKGEMLSLDWDKENQMITGISPQLFNDQGISVPVEGGIGESGNEQRVTFKLAKNKIKNSEKWTFVIKGLYLLKYEKK